MPIILPNVNIKMLSLGKGTVRQAHSFALLMERYQEPEEQCFALSFINYSSKDLSLGNNERCKQSVMHKDNLEQTI